MQKQFDKVCAGSDTAGLKPLVLVLNVKSCCGLRFKIDPHPIIRCAMPSTTTAIRKWTRRAVFGFIIVQTVMNFFSSVKLYSV